jgi:dTDP-4-dehydrorhamnose reductase
MARLANERKELRIANDQFGAPTSAKMIADALASILQLGRPKLHSAFGQRNHEFHSKGCVRQNPV